MKVAFFILLFSCLLDTLSALACAKKDNWDWSGERNPIIWKEGKICGRIPTLWYHNLLPIIWGVYLSFLIGFISTFFAAALLLLLAAAKFHAALGNFIYATKRPRRIAV